MIFVPLFHLQTKRFVALVSYWPIPLVLVSKSLFYEILERIKRLKPIPIGYD